MALEADIRDERVEIADPAVAVIAEDIAGLQAKRDDLSTEIVDQTKELLRLSLRQLLSRWPRLGGFCFTQRFTEWDDSGPSYGLNLMAIDYDGVVAYHDRYAAAEEAEIGTSLRKTLVVEIDELLRKLDLDAMREALGEYQVIEATRKEVRSTSWYDFEFDAWKAER